MRMRKAAGRPSHRGGSMQAAHSTSSSTAGSLAVYLGEISRYQLLSQDEERRLARLYRRSNDPEAAKPIGVWRGREEAGCPPTLWPRQTSG
ncbi:MAG: sigma-70 factor domain-containing protein [Myxococcales bacterium]